MASLPITRSRMRKGAIVLLWLAAGTIVVAAQSMQYLTLGSSPQYHTPTYKPQAAARRSVTTRHCSSMTTGSAATGIKSSNDLKAGTIFQFFAAGAAIGIAAAAASTLIMGAGYVINLVNNFLAVAGTTVTASSTQVATASAAYTATYAAEYATTSVTGSAIGSSTATVTTTINVGAMALYDLAQTGFVLFSTTVATGMALGVAAAQKKYQDERITVEEENRAIAAKAAGSRRSLGGWGVLSKIWKEGNDPDFEPEVVAPVIKEKKEEGAFALFG